MQARRRAQPSGTNSPSSSHPRLKHRARCVIFFRARHAAARVAPERGPGRLHREAAGERPPRARPQRRGSPGPIPNPAVKPAFAESTAARGCGRAGRRARGGRFSMLARFRARGDVRRRAACAGRGPQGGCPPAAFSAFRGCSLRCGASYFCVYGQRLRPFLCSGRVLPKGARLPQEPEDSWGVLASLFCITELMRRAQNGRSNRFTDETWRRI